MKNITVNNQLTPEEIESKVWVESTRLFPNLVEDIYIDFAITGPSSQNSSQNNVLVVACRKEFINSLSETMKLADLSLKIVDINYFAYERSLILMAKQSPDIKTVALLNVGFFYIDLIVMHEGNAVYTHETSHDGSNLKKISQSQMEHKYAKVTEGMDPPVVSQEFNIRDILSLSLGMQIKHTMQFFYSSRPNIRLQRVILSGDCAIAFPELLSYVQTEIGKEVILADPFKEMVLSSRIDKEKLARHTPELVLCCGLALRNLL